MARGSLACYVHITAELNYIAWGGVLKLKLGSDNMGAIVKLAITWQLDMDLIETSA